MPTDVALIVTLVTIGFILFAGALAWVDHYSKQGD